MNAVKLYILIFVANLMAQGQVAAGRLAEWRPAGAEEAAWDQAKLAAAAAYGGRGNGAGMVIHGDRVVYRWGNVQERRDVKSTTKSIGALALGLALRDGKVSLQDRVVDHLEEFAAGWTSDADRARAARVTLLQLATHTSGLDKPGGQAMFLANPATTWSYSDGGPNWLADVLTARYGLDLEKLLFERVFRWIGVKADHFQWRSHAYREPELRGVPRREFGSGAHLSVDAMARIGYLFLRAGGLGNRRLLPSEFVAQLRAPLGSVRNLPVNLPERYPGAAGHYGILWWNNADGVIAKAPQDLYWSWGLYDSLIAVIPSLDVVVVRAGGSLADKGQENVADFSRLRPLLEPIVEAIPEPSRRWEPPYPWSERIAGIDWSPLDSIRRAAPDCDNWPMTWLAKDTILAACGDGRGFAPYTKQKMGLVLAEIRGDAKNFTGRNLATSLDNEGMGAEGEKASGLLMVDNVVYLWLRNAGNAQLAWSEDEGRTWRRANWKLRVSFGHPAFLNYGRNYAGAKDSYVYIYSPDANSAYESVPNLVLARVKKNRIRELEAYEYFSGLEGGRPQWSTDIQLRAAVFQNRRDGCYRTHVSYHAGTNRYLLTYALQGPVNTRFQGGLGVFEGRTPWGPWRTVEYVKIWDSAPGESLSFPVKWMEADGVTLHLASSSDDALSVRQGKLRIGRVNKENK